MNGDKFNYLPYGLHQVLESDIDQVVDVLRNKKLTQGEVTENFENSLSKKVASKYCIAVNSATSALHLSCLALGLKPNDILWTSPNSFVASANCGIYCGAKVDFVDVNPKTGLMSVSKLRKKLEIAKIEQNLPKVIIPVHLSGAVCDMKEIANLSREYNFSIIEDASHAIGSKYKDESVGNCKYSDLTVFSFHPVKMITTGEGGCITTNRKKLFDQIIKLRSHGITKNQEEFEFAPSGDWSYEQQLLGFNYRMSDINAALGLNQLKRIDEIVAERNNLLDNYKSILDDLPIKFLEIPNGVQSSVHLGVIRFNNKDPIFHKNVFDNFRKNNIGVQVHYTPIHLHPFYRKMGFKIGDFPESELYSKNALSLPLFIGLSKEEQERVAFTLRMVM